MTPTAYSRSVRQAGFSVVELMVAMTLSLILMAGALSILYSTKLTNTENERMARVQEAGRTAFELIGQDARSAGYIGCSRQSPDAGTNPPNTYFNNGLTATSLLWNFIEPVHGFEATSATAWSPALDAAIPSGSGASPTPMANSDVLVVRAARPGAPIFRTNAAFANNADIPVDRDGAASTLAAQTPVIISDCQGADVFAVSDFSVATPTATTATISHAVLSGTPVINNSSGTFKHTYGAGALVQPVQTVIYYVASCTAVVSASACNTSTTPPALWQIVGAGPPQELIQGVEAMQVKYGIDTNGDFLADNYVTADAVTNWASVVSINIAILVRSVDENGTDVDTKTYALLGGTTASGGHTYGPFNDRRARQIFSTTITIRNIAP